MKARQKIFYHYLLRMLSLSLLPVIALSLIFLLVSIPREKEAVLQESRNNLALIQENIALLLNDSLKIMNLVNNTANISRLKTILGKRNIGYDEYIFCKQLAFQMNAIVNSRDYIDSIYVYAPNDTRSYLTNQANIFTVSGPLPSDQYWLDYASANERYKIVRRQANPFPYGSVIRNYLTIIQQNDRGLVVAINIMSGYFRRIFQNLNPEHGQKIMVIYRGEVQLSSDETQDMPAAPEDQYLVLRSFLYDLGLELYSLTPKSVAYDRVNRLLAFFTGTAVMCIVISVIYSIRYSDYLELQAVSLELSALQYQMQPHFLLNTLQLISFEALRLLKKPDRAQGSNIQFLIDQLSLFLQYSLKPSGRGAGSDVTAEDEIRATGYYTSIMQSRYGERLAVIWEIGEDIREYLMPKFILQPLIENAIRHGMSGGDSALEIRAGIRRDGPALCVEVADNGRGITAGELESLRSSLAVFISFREKHIGLRNLYRRLNLRYGKNFSMNLQGEQGQGFSVRIRIPLINSK